MTCSNSAHFRTCGITGGDFIVSASVPSDADPGAVVTIPITVTMNCLICLERVVVIVYLSGSSNNCISDTGELSFASWGIYGSTIDAELRYTQPSNRDFNGTISVVQIGLFSDTCTDSKTVYVPTNFPPGTSTWGCNNNQCLNGYGSLPPGCNNTCGDGGGDTQCTDNQIDIFGSCVKKNDLLIGGAAILAFMYFSKQ